MPSDAARLACTVRGCGLPLTRDDRRLICASGHSYDVARSGYVNLLQPHDRRSLDAGDPKDVVESRSRLIAAGVGRRLIETVAARIARHAHHDGQIADLGCGSGDALAAMASAAPRSAGIGVDLSAAAVAHAARRYPALTWIVANADRVLPFPDASMRAVVSMHARRNPDETRRILESGGMLVVAVPAADDLIELRAAVQGQAVEHDRVEALIAAHTPGFTLVERTNVTDRHRLEGALLRDLLRVTYRGQRRSEAPSAGALDAMTVTLAADLVVFANAT